jgi:hypothetical protein
VQAWPSGGILRGTARPAAAAAPYCARCGVKRTEHTRNKLQSESRTCTRCAGRRQAAETRPSRHAAPRDAAGAAAGPTAAATPVTHWTQRTKARAHTTHLACCVLQHKPPVDFLALVSKPSVAVPSTHRHAQANAHAAASWARSTASRRAGGRTSAPRRPLPRWMGSRPYCAAQTSASELASSPRRLRRTRRCCSRRLCPAPCRS